MVNHDPIDSVASEMFPSQHAHYYDYVPFLPSSLTIAHLNVCSLLSDPNKLLLLGQLCNDSNCDAFVVTETWLNGFQSRCCNIPGYSFLHSPYTGSKTRGFGVGCFVQEKWSTEIIDTNYDLSAAESQALEFLAFKIRSDHYQSMVLAVYRSPSESNIANFDQALDKILHVLRSGSAILILM